MKKYNENFFDFPFKEEERQHKKEKETRDSKIIVLLVTGKHAKAAALLHSSEIFLSLPHVGVNLVHALLDPVQLFCFVLQEFNVSWPAIRRFSLAEIQRGKGNHAREDRYL